MEYGRERRQREKEVRKLRAFEMSNVGPCRFVIRRMKKEGIFSRWDGRETCPSLEQRAFSSLTGRVGYTEKERIYRGLRGEL